MLKKTKMLRNADSPDGVPLTSILDRAYFSENLLKHMTIKLSQDE